MRVLLVSLACPAPPVDGLRLQVSGLLRGLQALGHEVVVVAPVGPDDDVRAARSLCHELVAVPVGQVGPRRVHRLRAEVLSTLGRRPVLVQQVRSSPLPRVVAATARRVRPDVVHLTPGWAADLAAAVGDVPVVLAPLDATGPNWDAEAAARGTPLGRHLSRREGRRLRRYERLAYPRAGEVVVVTERDAELLRSASPRLRPRVVPNGVDVDHWRRPAGAAREDGLVVLTGAMSYPPNVAAARTAARHVLPLVRQRVPGARLRLVGRDPAPEVLALAGDAVEVTGTVDDLRPHLWAAAAYLCPMTSGSGIKNKLLEALAAGCPTVATPLACAGTGAESGAEVLLADTGPGLADAVAAVLADRRLAERLAAGGVRRAQELSWRRTAEGFEAAYRSAAQRGGHGATTRP